jgi:hypothetical protein
VTPQASNQPLKFPEEIKAQAVYYAKKKGGWTEDSDVTSWNVEDLVLRFHERRNKKVCVCVCVCVRARVRARTLNIELRWWVKLGIPSMNSQAGQGRHIGMEERVD